MTPGRFRRRLSEDRGSDSADGGDVANHVPNHVSDVQRAPRLAWPALNSLPWLSPRAPLRDVRLSCFKSSYLPPGTTVGAANGASSGEEQRGGVGLGRPGSSQTSAPSSQPAQTAQGAPPSARPRHKSNENVYYVTRSNQDKGGPGVCLGARLRALSARCLALVHADRPRKAHISGRRPPTKQRSFSSGALPGLVNLGALQAATRNDDADAEERVGERDSLLVDRAERGVSVERDGRDSVDGDVLRDRRDPRESRTLRSASLDRDQDHNALLSSQFSAHVRRNRASTKSTSSSSEISEIFSRFQRRRVAGGAPTGVPVAPGCPPATAVGPAGSPPQLPPQLPPRAPARAFQLVRLTRTTPTEELGIFIAKSEAPERGQQGYVVAHIVPDGLAHRDGQLRLGDELVVVNGRQLRGLSMSAARQRLRAGPAQVDIVIARPERVDRAQCCCRCGSDGADVADSAADSGLDSSGDSHTDSHTDSHAEAVCRACGRLQGSSPSGSPRSARSARILQESSVDYENVVLNPKRCELLLESPQPPPDPPPDPPEPPEPPELPQHTNTRPPDSSPNPHRHQLFHKHKTPNARRSLALQSGPHEPGSLTGEAPATRDSGRDEARETQHHSLKRRGARGASRSGGAGGRGGGGAPRGSELLVELRKGPGCGALGFTVVGGADSPRGQLPIFVRSVLDGGQAARDGRLMPGDELVSLNGQALRGATHAEAVAMFRAVRAGPVLLSVVRRTAKKAQSCSDLVLDQEPCAD